MKMRSTTDFTSWVDTTAPGLDQVPFGTIKASATLHGTWLIVTSQGMVVGSPAALTSLTPFDTSRFQGLLTTKSLALALTTGLSGMTSLDGQQWTEVTLPTIPLQATSTDSLFVLMNSNHNLNVSADGTSWSTLELPQGAIADSIQSISGGGQQLFISLGKFTLLYDFARASWATTLNLSDLQVDQTVFFLDSWYTWASKPLTDDRCILQRASIQWQGT